MKSNLKLVEKVDEPEFGDGDDEGPFVDFLCEHCGSNEWARSYDLAETMIVEVCRECMQIDACFIVLPVAVGHGETEY